MLNCLSVYAGPSVFGIQTKNTCLRLAFPRLHPTENYSHGVERAGILMFTFMLNTLMSKHDCIRYKKHPIYVHKLAFLDAETDLIAGTLENTGDATQDKI